MGRQTDSCHPKVVQEFSTQPIQQQVREGSESL